jgi:hypothetical protein
MNSWPAPANGTGTAPPPDHLLTHLAIWEGRGEDQCPETEWGDLVTDAEYHAQPAPGRAGLASA